MRKDSAGFLESSSSPLTSSGAVSSKAKEVGEAIELKEEEDAEGVDEECYENTAFIGT